MIYIAYKRGKILSSLLRDTPEHRELLYNIIRRNSKNRSSGMVFVDTSKHTVAYKSRSVYEMSYT